MAVDQGGPGAEAAGAGHAEADRPAADPAPPAGAPGDAADPANIATQQDFGRELTRARQRAGLTVREVARAARIPASTAGDYFAGRHLPPPSQPGLLPRVLAAMRGDRPGPAPRMGRRADPGPPGTRAAAGRRCPVPRPGQLPA